MSGPGGIYIPGLVDPYLQGGTSGRRGGASSVWTPASVAAADRGFWFESTIVHDSGTPDKVTEWTDLWGSYDVAPDVVGHEPEYIGNDTDYAAGVSIDFTSVNLDDLTGGTNADFKYLHDGSGGTVGGAFNCKNTAAAQVVIGTMNSAATNTGLLIITDGTAEDMQIYWGDGTGAFVLNTSTSASSCPINQVNTFAFQCEDAASGDDWYFWLNGSLVLSGTISVTPSTANSTGELHIGRRVASTWYFDGTMGEMVGLKGLYGAELAAYLAGRHG